MGAASGNLGAEALLGGACPRVSGAWAEGPPQPSLRVQKLLLEVGSHPAGSRDPLPPRDVCPGRAGRAAGCVGNGLRGLLFSWKKGRVSRGPEFGSPRTFTTAKAIHSFIYSFIHMCQEYLGDAHRPRPRPPPACGQRRHGG